MTAVIKFTPELTANAVRTIASTIKQEEWRPEVIVGLTRGGLVPAVMLSHALNIRMMPLHWATRDFVGYDSLEILRPFRNVLIVDDICDTGRSINTLLYSLNIVAPLTKVRTAMLVLKHTQSYRPNYHWFNVYEADKDAWVEFYWEAP